VKAITGKNLLTFSFLFICLLMPCSASKGVVLCIGTNGHIALETNHYNPCCNAFPTQPTDTCIDTGNKIQRHKETTCLCAYGPSCFYCQPCIDIYISMTTAVDRFRIQQVKEVPQISTLPNSLQAADSAFITSAAPEVFNSIKSHSDLLHTVILLV